MKPPKQKRTAVIDRRSFCCDALDFALAVSQCHYIGQVSLLVLAARQSIKPNFEMSLDGKRSSEGC